MVYFSYIKLSLREISRFGVHKFTMKGRIRAFNKEVKELHVVEQQMEIDDETTAYQLHGMLIENGIEISFFGVVLLWDGRSGVALIAS